MKTVFTNDMVAHTWAAQQQPHARNASGSLSFDGFVLRSYVTPIAMIHRGARGEDVVLLTSEKYSMTTSSKHMPAAYSATRHMIQFTVPGISAYGGFHDDNLGYLVGQYANFVTTMLRANSWYATGVEHIEDQLNGYTLNAIKYAQVFGLPVPTFPGLREDAQKIADRRARLTAKRNDPKYRARNERAAARREAAEELREEKKRAERAALYAERVARWRAGENVAVPPYSWDALLRIKGDEVQTSRGASVPLYSARRMAQFIRTYKLAGRVYEDQNRPGDAPRMVGQFTLTHINAEGDVRIGCHNIRWAEIEAFLKQAEERTA